MGDGGPGSAILIGLDTSVLVRYLVGTPAAPARKAAALVDGADDVGVSPVALNKPSRALASFARPPGCTRAITIGTGSPASPMLAQDTISSPSSGLTDWTRSVICRNNCPVSEFHQLPNAAFRAA